MSESNEKMTAEKVLYELTQTQPFKSKCSDCNKERGIEHCVSCKDFYRAREMFYNTNGMALLSKFFLDTAMETKPREKKNIFEFTKKLTQDYQSGYNDAIKQMERNIQAKAKEIGGGK